MPPFTTHPSAFDILDNEHFERCCEEFEPDEEEMMLDSLAACHATPARPPAVEDAEEITF